MKICTPCLSAWSRGIGNELLSRNSLLAPLLVQTCEFKILSSFPAKAKGAGRTKSIAQSTPSRRLLLTGYFSPCRVSTPCTKSLTNSLLRDRVWPFDVNAPCASRSSCRCRVRQTDRVCRYVSDDRRTGSRASGQADYADRRSPVCTVCGQSQVVSDCGYCRSVHHCDVGYNPIRNLSRCRSCSGSGYRRRSPISNCACYHVV